MKKLMIALAVAVLASGGASAADLGGKLLKVGSDTTSPPMESVDPATGQIVGFDIDVVNAICAKINCQAEFVTTGWDGIFAALDQGNFDLVASGVSITEERKKAMDFSDPYIVNSQAVLMRVEDQGVSLEDFKSKGKKLSAQANTTDAQVAEGVVGKENVVAYDSFSAAIIALKNKDVDGVVINGANAAAYEREFVGELVVAIRDLESDPLGLVFRKGDANVAAFNEGLKMIRDDGTLDQLVNKYWGVK
ncbi:transporter substrate-binding domain-containing protein (plasmid) [Sinorhizobium meliloti WSM1022]|jgi:polar amino acid transport system substrate-binding protein|uniref:Amino acid uptake ABC transporter periplasmic solute-binding protein n=6 Tax=Rhizobium meliloti TaxID=382 RepID=Q926F7_RHIME|nr:transporter substrate-binding domain-containing protein [Sinorhizobium meliloti]AEG56281.1 ABC-type transporter, periplasmic subunit family 3 [Sinorhizobium meliloti AK83]AEH83329.1 putative amino acid uptake ABC transporter periplasmic solute-binding protein precursor [Sinorhizobium meliloti SM11]AGA10604.1 ABC-type amino acid transport/signal transduction systems, periplasmic component/domain protein [Sinorhizobium meliloti GR4]AGG72109.1 Putative amino acid uptake ABC transporter periplas